MPEQQLQLRIVLLGKESTLSDLNDIKQQINQLNKTSADGVKSERLELDKRKQSLREAQFEYKKLTDEVKQQNQAYRGMSAPIGSITRLRAETSNLRREAGLLNLETKEGVQRFKEMQVTIDANARKIRDFDRSLSGSNTLVGEYSLGIGAAAEKLAGLLATYISIQGAIQAVGYTFRTNLQLDSLNRSLELASKNSEQFDENLTFLRQTAEKFGLPLLETERGLRNFYAAAINAGLGADQTRKIFAQVSEVAANLRLSQDQVNSTFLAFEQMISKGTVSTEELRRQLGNAIPGAFELGAQAMKKTTAEFNKFVKSGKLATTDFLPAFADKLVEVFGNGGQQVEGLQASLNRFNNTLVDLATDPNGGISAFFSKILDEGAETIKMLDELLKSSNKLKTFWDQLRGIGPDGKALSVTGSAIRNFISAGALLPEDQKNIALSELKDQQGLIEDITSASQILAQEQQKLEQARSQYGEGTKEFTDQLISTTKYTTIVNQLTDFFQQKFPDVALPVKIETKQSDVDKFVSQLQQQIADAQKTLPPPPKGSSGGGKVPKEPTLPFGLFGFEGRQDQIEDKAKKSIKKIVTGIFEATKAEIKAFGKKTPNLAEQMFPGLSKNPSIFSDSIQELTDQAKQGLTQYRTIQSLLEANGFTGDNLKKALAAIFKDGDPGATFRDFIDGLTENPTEQLTGLEQVMRQLGQLTTDDQDGLRAYVAVLLQMGTAADQAGQSAKSMAEAFQAINAVANTAEALRPIVANLFTAANNREQGNIEIRIQEQQEQIRQLESDAERASGNRKAELEADLKNQRDYLDKLEVERDKARRKQVQREKTLALIDLGIQFAKDKGTILGNVAVLLSNPFTAPAALNSLAQLAILIGTYASSIAAITSKKYAKGGAVTGPRHSQGGVKFYNRASAQIEEYEGGEYITNRRAVANNLDTLEAINKWGDRIRFVAMPTYAEGGITARPLPLPRLPLPAASGQSVSDINSMMLSMFQSLNNRIDRLQVVNNAQDTVNTNNRQQGYKQVQNF